MATHRATLPVRRSVSAGAGPKKKPPASAPARRVPAVETIACAASRSQQGHSTNLDAFHVERGERPWVAVADGEGEAPGPAKRALQLLAERIAAAGAEAAPDWPRWREEIAAAVPGGAGCPWAAALLDSTGTVIGAAGPGIRAAVLMPGETACRWLADGGKFQTFAQPLLPGEVCLLFTDGAWRPLEAAWEQVLAAIANVWSWPAALLDLAGRAGRPDDMTVALLRRG
ncbi:MAG TPA: hypothetical protein VE996_00055 [Terriglobales bacterium]|nr:hypothetical protein [Terriglobales bacterium]